MTHAQILRRPQVTARTGFPRSTLYLKIARGEFPRPIKIGARAVGWLADDIDAWITERVAESRRLLEGAQS